MASFQENMLAYKAELEKGSIQQAYKGLMEYMLKLRSHFQNQLPGCEVPGSIYFGYMDMTYFSIIPPALKEHKLKIALVFLHEAFRFEVWLSGYNRQVQARYWKLIREAGWGHYRLVGDPLKADAILEHVLVEKPDFDDLTGLTAQIEGETLSFIANAEVLLSSISGQGVKNDNPF
jgi:hypothetical protein